MMQSTTLEESGWKVFRHMLKKHKLLIVLDYDNNNLPSEGTPTKEDGKVEPRYSWTDMDQKTLGRLGFKTADKFLDRLCYSGVTACIKKNNFREAAPKNKEKATTLCDFQQSNSATEFKKGLYTKVAFPKLEMKQLIVAIPICIGVVLGIYFLYLK